MTGPHPDTESTGARQISVAELLARNGNIGAPAPTRRRRRRRGDSDSISVAELTGEIPVVRADSQEGARPANGRVQVAEPAPHAPPEPVSRTVPETTAEHVAEHRTEAAYWSEPEPRWPKSSPQTRRSTGPERSEYPRPLRRTDESDATESARSGAEDMSPDPANPYGDVAVDVIDSEVREAEPSTGDSAYGRSYLQAAEGTSEHTLFGGQSIADEVARRRGGDKSGFESPAADELDEDRLELEDLAHEGPVARKAPGTLQTLWHGVLVVVQSILAVAFGAGLFVAFAQLWGWSRIVALVLSVLVILGLVVGVRVVRKTEDIASTLIAVAVGALVTLGPLLLQSG